VVIVFMATRPKIGHVAHSCIVWVSCRLITCELSSLCQESPSPRPIFGQRVLGQIRRTTSHEKQAIGFSLLYDHPVCASCIYINYYLDAVLVLHTRTASLVDTMEVQTQCRWSPTEIWYWSRGVCWRGNWKRQVQSLVARVVVIPPLSFVRLMSFLSSDWAAGRGGAEAIVCPQEQLQIARRRA
jgi:hypothetical protein